MVWVSQSIGFIGFDCTFGVFDFFGFFEMASAFFGLGEYSAR